MSSTADLRRQYGIGLCRETISVWDTVAEEYRPISKVVSLYTDLIETKHWHVHVVPGLHAVLYTYVLLFTNMEIYVHSTLAIKGNPDRQDISPGQTNRTHSTH